jgi:cell division protein FtsQ
MDGRGRLAEPVTGGADARPATGTAPGRRRARLRADHGTKLRLVLRWYRRIIDTRVPNGAGATAAALFVLSAATFGAVRGGHWPAVTAELADMRDATANSLGFRITSIALAGGKQITREEILTTAGVTGRTSLLFLDATEARARLKTNPWIAEATVLKLYPGRLHIEVTERQAFALWQKDGKVAVVASDGTMVEPYVARRFAKLPLVVGQGAGTKAKDFLAVLDKYPTLRDQVRASVFVAERRWNLRLNSGIDVKLPETEVERALDTLVKLDRDKKLLSRDIAVVDLRLADRATVRLSNEAAAARDEALRPAKPKRKGGDA